MWLRAVGHVEEVDISWRRRIFPDSNQIWVHASKEFLSGLVPSSRKVVNIIHRTKVWVWKYEEMSFSGSVFKARVQCIPSSDQAATVEGQMNIRHFSLLVFSSRSRAPFYMIRPPIAWDTALLHCVSRVHSCHFCDGQSDFLPRVFRHHPVSIFGFFFCSESCIYCNDKSFPPLLKLFWDWLRITFYDRSVLDPKWKCVKKRHHNTLIFSFIKTCIYAEHHWQCVV